MVGLLSLNEGRPLPCVFGLHEGARAISRRLPQRTSSVDQQRPLYLSLRVHSTNFRHQFSQRAGALRLPSPGQTRILPKEPLEKRRQKSGQAPNGNANESTGDNIAGEVHAAKHPTDGQQRRDRQQGEGHRNCSRKPACRDGEGRESMAARKRFARAIADNERRNRAAFVRARRIKTTPIGAHRRKPQSNHARQGSKLPRVGRTCPSEQYGIGRIEHSYDAAVENAKGPHNARTAPQGSRPLFVALFVALLVHIAGTVSAFG